MKPIPCIELCSISLDGPYLRVSLSEFTQGHSDLTVSHLHMPLQVLYFGCDFHMCLWKWWPFCLWYSVSFHSSLPFINTPNRSYLIIESDLKLAVLNVRVETQSQKRRKASQIWIRPHLKDSSLSLLSPGNSYGLEVDLDPPLVEALTLRFIKLSFMCVLYHNYPMRCHGNDCIVGTFCPIGVYIIARTWLASWVLLSTSLDLICYLAAFHRVRWWLTIPGPPAGILIGQEWTLGGPNLQGLPLLTIVY